MFVFKMLYKIIYISYLKFTNNEYFLITFVSLKYLMSLSHFLMEILFYNIINIVQRVYFLSSTSIVLL